MQNRNQNLEQQPAKTSNEMSQEHEAVRDLEPSANEITATYSPEDNKLRLYALHRLDPDTYARVKAAGFAWAPRQQLFVAPMWTPAREDLALSICGWIDAEESTLAERAQERSERFSDYRGNRLADAKAAREAVDAIAQRFECGQPVILGHHSTRRALRDKEKMDAGMRRAVNLWDTADYWKRRAVGALQHAEYKSLPAVRARRIKSLEANVRKQERDRKEAADRVEIWSQPMTQEQATEVAGMTCGMYFRIDGRSVSAYSALRDGSMQLEDVSARIVRNDRATLAHCDRWIAHYANRIAYEQAMLGETGGLPADSFALEQGGQILAYDEWVSIMRINRRDGRILSVTTEAPKRFSWQQRLTVPYEQITQYRAPTPQGKAAAKTPPLVNYPVEGCIEMTKAAYAALYSGYKGTRRAEATGTATAYRYRVAVQAGRLAPVFLTDTKVSEPPKAKASPVPAVGPLEVPPVASAAPGLSATANVPAVAAAHVDDEEPGAIEAMRATLRQGGVQVLVAPQLFPTSAEVAAQLVDLAQLDAGMTVLEPSAGTGVLLNAVDATNTAVTMTAVEINPGLCRLLRGGGRTVLEEDFLSVTPQRLNQVDRVLMNPPFANGADIVHILHALTFLKPGGLLVAICANGPRQNAKLRPLAEGSGGTWEPLPSGSFKHAGTNVNAVLLSIHR